MRACFSVRENDYNIFSKAGASEKRITAICFILKSGHTFYIPFHLLFVQSTNVCWVYFCNDIYLFIQKVCWFPYSVNRIRWPISLQRVHSIPWSFFVDFCGRWKECLICCVTLRYYFRSLFQRYRYESITFQNPFEFCSFEFIRNHSSILINIIHLCLGAKYFSEGIVGD